MHDPVSVSFFSLNQSMYFILNCFNHPLCTNSFYLHALSLRTFIFGGGGFRHSKFECDLFLSIVCMKSGKTSTCVKNISNALVTTWLFLSFRGHIDRQQKKRGNIRVWVTTINIICKTCGVSTVRHLRHWWSVPIYVSNCICNVITDKNTGSS